jgi:hypothetical protein
MKNKWLETPTALDRVSTHRLLLYIQKRHFQSVEMLCEHMTIEKAAEVAYEQLKILMEGIVKNKGVVDWRLTKDPMEFKLDIRTACSVDYITLNFTVFLEDQQSITPPTRGGACS